MELTTIIAAVLIIGIISLAIWYVMSTKSATESTETTTESGTTTSTEPSAETIQSIQRKLDETEAQLAQLQSFLTKSQY